MASNNVIFQAYYGNIAVINIDGVVEPRCSASPVARCLLLRTVT